MSEKMLTPEEIEQIQKEQGAAQDALDEQGKPRTFELYDEQERKEICADLGTYLKLHKETVITKDDPEYGKNNIWTYKPGEYVHSSRNVWDIEKQHWILDKSGDDMKARMEVKNEIYYIDKEGDVARVEINNTKISSYDAFLLRKEFDRGLHDTVRGGKGLKEYLDRQKKELEALGFYPPEKRLHQMSLERAVEAKKRRLEEEAKEQKKEAFDF